MGIWTKDGSIDQMAILAKKQKWHEGKSERVGVVTRWPTSATAHGTNNSNTSGGSGLSTAEVKITTEAKIHRLENKQTWQMADVAKKTSEI